ncbi:helix-turn-helix domain-containing protein [Nocardiopsis ansamitocini]|uniref:Homeodomain-like domain-containing protein n=1 Tax=Nocardiopsis ansamitocini TaxID=1670832 RepID=A0A9W6P4L2_9ACTN|nr:helix-turn-helix domain-containing protein [Nocardiopsis ansamitocini]GLU46913.1 hypothetical protein Nans01_12640 [Nocardiopsis ansamitocini]
MDNPVFEPAAPLSLVQPEAMKENTSSNQDAALRARAIDLRERGWSNPRIRAELGLSGWKLTQLLQGHVEPKHRNLANRAKPELRARALDLRRQGWSYDAIARELTVSKSSLSLWLRDLPKPEKPYPGPVPEGRAMTQKEWEEHCEDPASTRRRQVQQESVRKRSDDRAAAAEVVGELGKRELLIIGAAIYWCEGTKAKPWNRNYRVVFVNSDAGLIKLFLRFLAAMGVEKDRLGFTLSIHESADIGAATEFWAGVVGVGAERFNKPWIKRHNPSTVRKNVGESYQGCLVVQVYRSTELYHRIEALAKQVMDGSVSG